MNVHIIYHTNNFKILWKSSDTIESVLFFFFGLFFGILSNLYSFALLQFFCHSGHKSAIFNLFDLARFRTCLKRPLQNKKVTWQCEHNLNNQFFYLTREKKYLCSEQLKQPFYSLIHSNLMETCYEDTKQTTIF